MTVEAEPAKANPKLAAPSSHQSGVFLILGTAIISAPYYLSSFYLPANPTRPATNFHCLTHGSRPSRPSIENFSQRYNYMYISNLAYA